MADERQRRPLPRYNTELAAQFGITPGEPFQRETVRVDSIPTPPSTESMPPAATQAASGDAASPDAAPARSLDDAVAMIVSEEAAELGARLRAIGIPFPSPHEQQIIDTAMALVSGAIAAGGLAPARR